MLHSRLVTINKTPANYVPYLALFFGVIGLGMSAIFVRWASDASGVIIAFYRMGIATLVMALPFSIEVKRNTTANRTHFIWAALAGLFFAGDLGTWNYSAQMTSAANSTLLGNTSAIWVGLFTLFIFKQQLGNKFWIGMIIAFAGAILIMGEDFYTQLSFGLGSLLALFASFFYAGFFITTQRARAGLSSLSSWWISAFVSSATLFFVALLFSQPLTGYSSTTWWVMIAAALISQVGGYLSINYALGHLPAHIVSPTMLGQPVLTALLAVPLLGQGLSLIQIGGGLMVLAGIWLVNQKQRD